MEQMALQQESAYERLYRWSQSECRAMTSDSLDILPIQQQALKALQNRPVLFSYVGEKSLTLIKLILEFVKNNEIVKDIMQYY